MFYNLTYFLTTLIISIVVYILEADIKCKPGNSYIPALNSIIYFCAFQIIYNFFIVFILKKKKFSIIIKLCVNWGFIGFTIAYAVLNIKAIYIKEC